MQERDRHRQIHHDSWKIRMNSKVRKLYENLLSLKSRADVLHHHAFTKRLNNVQTIIVAQNQNHPLRPKTTLHCRQQTKAKTLNPSLCIFEDQLVCPAKHKI